MYRPVSVRPTESPATCPKLDCRADMDWIPAAPAVDLQFTPCTIHLRQPDGSYRETNVTSVTQMRQIERESEQRARNGEGEQIRFRMWSQNRSNGDANTFGPAPFEAPSAAAKAKFGRRGALKALGTEAPDVSLGDGVDEGSVSAVAVGE